MQAIRTVKLPATNTKGARIKATAAAGSITLAYAKYRAAMALLGEG